VPSANLFGRIAVLPMHVADEITEIISSGSSDGK